MSLDISLGTVTFNFGLDWDVMRFYIALSIFQSYYDFEAGIPNLWNGSCKTQIQTLNPLFQKSRA